MIETDAIRKCLDLLAEHTGGHYDADIGKASKELDGLMDRLKATGNHRIELENITKWNAPKDQATSSPSSSAK